VGVPADAVLFDHASGVHDAVAALAGLGHKHIGLLVGPPDTRASRDRIRGFISACEEAGISAGWDNIVQLSAITPETTGQATASLLGLPLTLTALVAGDTQLGVAVLTAMRERKLRPGPDLSVVISDDRELFRLVDPPMSVVVQDAEEMGAAAARLLIARISDGSSAPARQVLPTSFIARGSTAPPPKRTKLSAPATFARAPARQVARSGLGGR
jgi:LacI family transcriptional regulator